MKTFFLLKNKAFKISIFYCLFGVTWILISDTIVEILFTDAVNISTIQTFKGWFYVLVTGALIYHLIKIELDKAKEVEKKLRMSRQLFDDVVRNAEEWIWEVDADGVITYSSPAVRKLLGFNPDEIIGNKKLFDLFHPDDKKDFEDQARMFFRNKESFTKFQHRKIDKNGNEVWMLTSALPIIDDNGELIGYRGTDSNITERVKKENQLKESKERYRNFAELTFEGIVIHEKGIMLDFNNVFLKMTGYTPQELRGNSLLEMIIPEEYHPIVIKNIMIDYKLPYEMEFVKKSGKRIWVEVVARIVEYQNKKVRVTAIRDITWRKEAERKLKESEERYRSLSELTFEGLLIHRDEIMIDFNSSFQKMSGYTRDELLAKNFLALIPTEYHELIKKNNLLDYVPPYEIEAYTKNRKRIWFEVTSRQIDYEGKQARVTALRDITWRIDAENKLKESEERYRSIFNAYAIGIVIFNPAQEIVMANPAAYRIYGYSPGEMKKLNLTDIITKEVIKLYLPKVIDAYEKGESSEFDSLGQKKDGTIFSSHIILSPFINKNIPHVLTLVTDNTEKKLAEEELEKHRNHLESLVAERTAELELVNNLLEREIEKQKEAELSVKRALKKETELSELKSGFLSMASHEFRTPLTSVLSSADLLDMAGRTWDEEKYLHYINKIRNAVNNMTVLLNDVLTISRTKDGKIKPKHLSINVKVFIEELISEIQSLPYFKHQIEIVSHNLKGKIHLDPQLLRQCIENLIINAIKYSPQNSTIKLTIEKKKNNLEIIIEDNGPGIEKQELGKIFEPFYRIKSASKSPGSGLGLTIVKNAVEALRGDIQISSEIGLGTKFFINLPLKSNETIK